MSTTLYPEGSLLQPFELVLASLRQAGLVHRQPDKHARRAETAARLGLFAGLECLADADFRVDVPGAAKALADVGPLRLGELVALLRQRLSELPESSALGLNDGDWAFAKDAVAPINCTVRADDAQIRLQLKDVGRLDGEHRLVDRGPTVAHAAPESVFGSQSLPDLVASMWRAPTVAAEEINAHDHIAAAARLALQQLHADRCEQEALPDAVFRGSFGAEIVFVLFALAVLFGIIALGFGGTSPAPGTPAFWVAVVAGALAAIFAVLACAASAPACIVTLLIPASKCGALCA
ncbi:hypothetical protein [Methylibium rhizosphaerae]|uniref:hypothetical protein n=1 Tax=Methylibium rhizosphaerae TaxID=2570323 RepID=UPI00112C2259|nr:hypothetical protein [Methylibium rhizosphaerae]